MIRLRNSLSQFLPGSHRVNCCACSPTFHQQRGVIPVKLAASADFLFSVLRGGPIAVRGGGAGFLERFHRAACRAGAA